MAKISVVIASYNHEKYVAEAIESVLRQTCQDFEVVITDDGSTDRTVEAIRNFRDPRIRLFCFAKNRGASVAMNNSIREAHGEYVAALGSDDLCNPGRLRTQAAILDRSSEIGAVFSSVEVIDEGGKAFTDAGHSYFNVFRQPNRTRYEWLNHFFHHANALCHPSLMMRRKCHEEIGYFDERLAQLLDLDMWIRLCQRYDIYITPEELTKYRVRTGEISASGNRSDARIRLATEHALVLRNYLRIRDLETLYRIFPEAKRYGDSSDDSLVPFLLAKLALEKGDIPHRNFAMGALFELLGRPDTKETLQERFNFSARDFVQLTGECDLFNVEVANLLADATKQRSVLEAELRSRQAELDRIRGSLAWKGLNAGAQAIERVLPRGTRRRRVYDGGYGATKSLFTQGWGAAVRRVKEGLWGPDASYRKWIATHEPGEAELDTMARESAQWGYRPRISIVTPVFNPRKKDLVHCIQSVVGQIYDNWELCLVDGASDPGYVQETIARFAQQDHRIKHLRLPKNLGIAGNSNDALRLATGEFVAFLDHDDMLAPFALYEVVKSLNQDQALDFLFSDEDKVPSSSNKRYSPFFKPEWGPDTFRSYNYPCHFAVTRRALLERVGGLREGFDGSQDYDLLLRVTDATTKIRRIPKILYHWRASETSVASDMTIKPYAYPAAKKALSEHLNRRGLDGEVMDGFALGAYRVRYSVRPGQRVSIIVPTRDQVDLLKRCVLSILAATNWRHFQVVIVDNQSRERETREFVQAIQRDQRVRVIQYDQSFNFSALNNFAVRSTDTEQLVFLNNDTEVISPDWLTTMLEFAQRPDVGAVGIKLYYPDDTVQHGGVVIGLGGVAGHAFRGFPRLNHGYMGRLSIVQNVSTVTAACMMLRRAVFDEVGGFDERLSHAFNDVDLCLRIREKGYVNVFTPYAELYHHESASRGYDLATPERTARFVKEVEFMKTRWKHVLDAGDPYYNPNLTLEKPDFSLRL